jgi:hypothetical protein
MEPPPGTLQKRQQRKPPALSTNKKPLETLRISDRKVSMPCFGH